MEKVVLKRGALGPSEVFVPVRVARMDDLHVYVARYVGELARHRHPHDEFHIVLDGEVEIRIEGEGAQTLYRNEGLLVGGGVYHSAKSRSGADLLLLTRQEHPLPGGAVIGDETGAGDGMFG